MFNKKFLIIILVCLMAQLLSPGLVSAATPQETDYLKYFYNRYSKNFDVIGLKYSVPDYGIKNFQAAKTGRELASLAGYYKYRALAGEKKAKTTFKNNLLKAVEEVKKEKFISFEDSEALFLVLRLMEGVPDIFSGADLLAVRLTARDKIQAGIDAKDTENRAIVAVAHWQYLVDDIYDNGIITLEAKAGYDVALKTKLDTAIAGCITQAGWYFEGAESLVPHYQAVSAFMLWSYGTESNQKSYVDLAERMYLNLKKLAFYNGMVEAQIGHRPVGLGAQFYLMLGTLAREFNDSDADVYLNYASGDRFFSDPTHKNRLEYHRTSVVMKAKTVTVKQGKSARGGSALGGKIVWNPVYQSANYHDDYAFIDAGEMAVAYGVIPAKAGIQFTGMTVLKYPLNYTDDGEFQIQNDGTAIKIYNIKTRDLISLNYKKGKAELKKEANQNVLKALVPMVSLAPDEFVGAKITTPVQSYAIAGEDGAIIYGKNLARTLPLASLTKMMTALVFVEHRKSDWLSSINYNSSRHFVFGNYLHFVSGDTMMVKDVFYATLVNSINEAAAMLPDATDLTPEQFVAEMNKKARELGLTSTKYVDSSGYNIGNITTAEDQIKVLKAVFQNTEIRNVMSAPSYSFDAVNAQGKIVKHNFRHTNILIRQTKPFEILASKTGYLDEAQKCLAMAIKKNNKIFYFISLGDPSFSNNTVNTRILVNN